MDSDTKLLFDLPIRKPNISKQLGPDFEKKFDQPLSHRGDPVSSYKAGNRALRSRKIRGQTQAVLEALKRHPNTTSAELARLADLDRYAVARRLPNLAHRGLAERGPERMCSVCRCPCVTWRAIDG